MIQERPPGEPTHCLHCQGRIGRTRIILPRKQTGDRVFCSYPCTQAYWRPPPPERRSRTWSPR